MNLVSKGNCRDFLFLISLNAITLFADLDLRRRDTMKFEYGETCIMHNNKIPRGRLNIYKHSVSSDVRSEIWSSLAENIIPVCNHGSCIF